VKAVRIVDFDDGIAINASCMDRRVLEHVLKRPDRVPLIVTDPPYGGIVNASWDALFATDDRYARWMLRWTDVWSEFLLPNAAMYVWGGIGKPGFRPWFKYLDAVETNTSLRIANIITWQKRRAYGIQHNYLFTREECVYLFNGSDVKKPRCFNVPLLAEKRGYAGFNKKYPAKSEYKRRGNVWSDVTELFRGKVHEAQKPERLYEIPIEIHTKPGEWVIDMFAGSGTCALAARKLGRKFVVIEKDPQTFDMMVGRLRG
jgi:DNA modification methylase